MPSPTLSQRLDSSSVICRQISRPETATQASSQTLTTVDSDDDDDSTGTGKKKVKRRKNIDLPFFSSLPEAGSNALDAQISSISVGPAPLNDSLSFSQNVLTPALVLQWQKILEMIQEDLEQFVYLPVPIEIGDLQCRITRDKKGMEKGFFPTYYMHVERPGDQKKVRQIQENQTKTKKNSFSF